MSAGEEHVTADLEPVRAALRAYMDIDARLVQAEEAVRAARAREDAMREELVGPLGDFVALAQHLGDPERLLIPLQGRLQDEPALADVIERVSERAVEEVPAAEAPTMDEATVTAGIWLEEHLQGAGWLRFAAIVTAAQPHGIAAEHLDAARRDLVAIQTRGGDGGVEWRLALDAAFD